MEFVTLGVVSNVWGALFAESSLEAECERAVRAGYGYVELRQRAVPGGEETVPGDDRPWPLPDRLQALAARFPQLGFNLAVEAPFLTTPLDPNDPYLQRCVEAAVALGGNPPVLRLVDVSPASSLLSDPGEIRTLAEAVAAVARSLSHHGVALALENSRQPVAPLLQMLRLAGDSLSGGIPSPRLCWDPMNQAAQTLAPEDPLTTARDLSGPELFEFHFKQARNGELLPDVQDGDLPWSSLLLALRDGGFRGPALFEIAPGPDIWPRLDRSTAYIRSLLEAVDPSRG
ncbi:MAG: sugar phosphate isomerase/epimerase family protein [Armatimonadota bacterium]